MRRASGYAGALVILGNGIGVGNSAKVSSYAMAMARRKVAFGLSASGIWSRTHCRNSVTERVFAIVLSSGI